MFLGWLGWLSTELIDQWAGAITFEWLDQLALDRPGSSARAGTPAASVADGSATISTVEGISGILNAMAEGDRAKQRARTYLMDRLTTLHRLPFRLVDDFPDVAVALVRAGGRVELENPRGGGWNLDSGALRALRQVDAGIAEQVLTDSEGNLVEALQAPQKQDIKGLATFIALADDFSKQHIDQVLANVDAARCEPVWRDRLADAPEDAVALFERAATTEGPLGDAARRLLAT